MAVVYFMPVRIPKRPMHGHVWMVNDYVVAHMVEKPQSAVSESGFWDYVMGRNVVNYRRLRSEIHSVEFKHNPDPTGFSVTATITLRDGRVFQIEDFETKELPRVQPPHTP